ncbi:MAG: OmpA family protein, partial [Candidatus Competibacteraceae bacterium]|nr:OmpA family protein [Candidatus Competibacteraceae bacterium]
REYNIGLGERRADAVRRLMGAMGVAPQQMRVVSYGEERPAVGGSDEESYSLNRRVEIVY